MADSYTTQKVLELACAAQRTYGDYLKDAQSVFDVEGKFVCLKHSNKELVKFALGANRNQYQQEYRPIDLILVPEDTDQANEIRQFFKRLMFSAVAGTNDFEIEVNSLLESETIPANKIGYIACLPSVYLRERAKKLVKKSLAECDNEPLGAQGSTIIDKDCEIIEAKRSKNFDAWNVLAIIDNKIVSWFNKFELKTGPAVVQKGKIKDYRDNWQTKKIETRLNYVKVAQ